MALHILQTFAVDAYVFHKGRTRGVVDGTDDRCHTAVTLTCKDCVDQFGLKCLSLAADWPRSFLYFV